MLGGIRMVAHGPSRRIMMKRPRWVWLRVLAAPIVFPLLCGCDRFEPTDRVVGYQVLYEEDFQQPDGTSAAGWSRLELPGWPGTLAVQGGVWCTITPGRAWYWYPGERFGMGQYGLRFLEDPSPIAVGLGWRFSDPESAAGDGVAVEVSGPDSTGLHRAQLAHYTWDGGFAAFSRVVLVDTLIALREQRSAVSIINCDDWIHVVVDDAILYRGASPAGSPGRGFVAVFKPDSAAVAAFDHIGIATQKAPPLCP
jgi:hypothetical protein